MPERHPALRSLSELLTQTLGFGSEIPGLAEVLFAALLSLALTSLVAWTYRATHRSEVSRDYVHSLLILGTVVSVFVMIIRSGDGDRALATGFGMLAAFSVIRFRTALSQTRDIGFIFFAMTSGLAVGARHYVPATGSTAVLCAIIWWFSRSEWFVPPGSSHSLRVRVAADMDHQAAFMPVFAELASRHELLSVETNKRGTRTELRYRVTLRPGRGPGELVTAIQQRNGNDRVLLTSVTCSRADG
jgi:hypothetical protein